MKIFKFVFVLLLASTCGLGLVLSGCKQKQNIVRVGIVLPIEHQALNEIVTGFKTTLAKLYNQPIEFKVANAQGDMNMQRAIIEQMRDANYAMIVPVATGTAQMTAMLVAQKPIVALAALYSEQERHARKTCNVAVVDDEINKAQIINFMHRLYPDLHTLTLIHSPADKIFLEIAEVQTAALRYGVNLQKLMISNLSELYAVGQALSPTSQALFIFKDSMIASGIDTLVMLARSRQIPLITSDESTVAKGAAFAIGVHEKQIGEEGAKLAVQILQGKTPCQLPITQMTQPTVFINNSVLPENNPERQHIEKLAAQLHLPVEIIKSLQQK